MTIAKPETFPQGQALAREGPTPETLSNREVYLALRSGPEGLTQSEAAARIDQYGPNVLAEVGGKPLIVKLLANFTHLMALLLWARKWPC